MGITILGAGAIGGTVGAFLAKAGEDVLFVDVVKEHVEAMNARGLTITGRAEFTVPVRATTPEALRGPLEWVFLSVKAQHTEVALKPVIPLLGPTRSVSPFGSARRTFSIATMPFAPGRFSTMKGWPKLC